MTDLADGPGGRDERDQLVARALHDLPVPDHRPGFWDDLEASVAATVDEPAPAVSTGPSTGELPAVTALADRPSPASSTSRRRLPFVFGAAAAVILLVAVGLVLLGGDGDDDATEVAQAPEVTTTAAPDATTTTTTGATAVTTTTAAPPVMTAAGEPAEVVATWLDAIGEGDVAAAAALTGPRTAAYIQSQDPAATVESFLTESQEALGAWAGSDDREIATTAIGPLEFDGGTLSVVVVRGTHPDEAGADGPRVDVFPLVDDGEGFKVEHLAFSPAHANDPVFTVPPETGTGLGAVEPDAEINVFVPTPGEVWFSLDGQPAESDTTSIVAEEPFALHDPPGDLEPGPHELVVVALGEDGTISHYGGTFDVES
jgi:hypothetical protein